MASRVLLCADSGRIPTDPLNRKQICPWLVGIALNLSGPCGAIGSSHRAEPQSTFRIRACAERTARGGRAGGRADGNGDLRPNLLCVQLYHRADHRLAFLVHHQRVALQCKAQGPGLRIARAPAPTAVLHDTVPCCAILRCAARCRRLGEPHRGAERRPHHRHTGRTLHLPKYLRARQAQCELQEAQQVLFRLQALPRTLHWPISVRYTFNFLMIPTCGAEPHATHCCSARTKAPMRALLCRRTAHPRSRGDPRGCRSPRSRTECTCAQCRTVQQRAVHSTYARRPSLR